MQKYVTPTWYEQRRHVTIPVHSEGALPGPLSQETLVVLRLKGENLRMHVPTWCYDENTGAIPAEAIGEWNDEVLFVFPQTQLGRHTLGVPKDEVESWLKQEDLDLNSPIRNIW